MSYKLRGGFCVYIILMSIAGELEAAITPQDTSYSASVGENVTFPWVYENEADMFTVTWTYKEPSAALATSIMFQSQGSPAVPSSNFNVEHKGNGGITVKQVTESDSGIYYCEVAYSLSSGHQAVTGTATLTVFAPTTSATTTSATTTSDCGLKVFHNCKVSDEGGVVAWVFISIAIAALVTIAIILILKFVFDVKFPCRGHRQN